MTTFDARTPSALSVQNMVQLKFHPLQLSSLVPKTNVRKLPKRNCHRHNGNENITIEILLGAIVVPFPRIFALVESCPSLSVIVPDI